MSPTKFTISPSYDDQLVPELPNQDCELTPTSSPDFVLLLRLPDDEDDNDDGHDGDDSDYGDDGDDSDENVDDDDDGNDDSGPGHYTDCGVFDDDEQRGAICETVKASILCSSTFAEDQHHHHHDCCDEHDYEHYDHHYDCYDMLTWNICNWPKSV